MASPHLDLNKKANGKESSLQITKEYGQDEYSIKQRSKHQEMFR